MIRNWLITARKSIEQELKQNGLFKGTVDATTVEDPVNHQMTIGFVVNAGKRAKYDFPKITGDTKLSDSHDSRRHRMADTVHSSLAAGNVWR